MTSIRRFVYAAALTLSALSIAPSLASAQEAHGRFTLAHEVHWQNALVPAGDYEFSFKASGPSELLFVRRLSGSGPGFMMLVNDTAETKPSDLNQLVLVSREGKSFVSTMDVPEAGVTLHFAMPSEIRQLAMSGKASTSSSTR